jgi:hypothetical protein
MFPLIALLVAIIVFWCLKLVGITITSEALCELEEHTHVSSCYTGDELTCLKPEHTHSTECFPEKSADTETSADWKKTLEKVIITNNLNENLVGVATSQVGYTESSRNYEYNAFAEKNNYTRYGEWYGSPYANWNTLFVSFCIDNANIKNAESLEKATAEAMQSSWENENLYYSADKYLGERGDVVFFDTNSDGRADRTGIAVFRTDNILIAIEGDVEGSVKAVTYMNPQTVMGYGKTSKLFVAEQITSTNYGSSVDTGNEKISLAGKVNRYIPREIQRAATFSLRQTAIQSVYDSEPLVTMPINDDNITYTSNLENEVVNATIKDLTGSKLEQGATVYIGQTYIVSLEFSEINTGDNWIQFRHNEDGYLTYQIPSNLDCQGFDSWHPISAKTENGTIEDVGEYFIDDNGLLKVKFFEDSNGVNFVEKYANVDFTIDFNATVASTQSGTSTEITFNDNININVNIDGGAGMDVTKTAGDYDAETNTLEYTILVKGTYGVVKDLVITDDIWQDHYALKDTVVVTDLDGNPINPQPTVGNHPYHDTGAHGGFVISDFPDFSAGEGYIIKYKASIYENLLTQDSVGLWNGAPASGKDSNGNTVEGYDEEWTVVTPEKMKKQGKQSVIKDNNGNDITVIEWSVGIRKNTNNLQGTVVIDTLGDGLSYYTGKPIYVVRYDEYGGKSETTINWNEVTVNGNSMSFPLPDCYACDIVYYTTFEELAEDEVKNYTNSVRATINGKEEQTHGNANVVGFVPKVQKSARGDDGKFVYYTITADIPGVIEDWGGFFLTDLSAIWNYNGTGTLYIENAPEGIEITATTESGQTITFTPYVKGGPTENTYTLIYPSNGDEHHSFKILFNTDDDTTDSSKWILTEDAVLTINYKIPFDAKTGTEWSGELTGENTLEDALLQGNALDNEAYFNYTKDISVTSTSRYEYSPILNKKAYVNEDGSVDYKVSFNNTVPGSSGSEGYLDSGISNSWFEDTFDEKLEYVPGSLIVTCYTPWNPNLWITKYRYNGTVTGNSFNVPATEFTFYQFNPEAVGWEGMANATNFRDYYNWANSGGRFVFTYTLKLKDEYLTTTEHSKLRLDNTAEVTWGPDNTSGPASESVEYETGLLDKQVVQEDSKLNFEVHINRSALDILKNSDTLVIEDTMTHNLSVYWNSIKLKYENDRNEWIDFDSADSEYTYSVTYDPTNNKLTFVVPDSLHIIIDYTTLITESGQVSVNNSVKIDGKAEVSDVIDAIFKVEEHSGGASGSNNRITLIKQDGLTNAPLPDATFLLYGPMGDTSATAPPGVSRTLITEDGTVLKFIGTYTTGDNGTIEIENQYLTPGGPYAFLEMVAPEGYNLLDKPVYFYFFKEDPNGIIQSVTTLIAIENFSGSFLIPETGYGGILTMAIIGITATVSPILYSFIRRKRERRLKKIS